MQTLDRKLLEGFEALARWLQYRTGWNCFFWSRCCFVVAFLYECVNIWMNRRLPVDWLQALALFVFIRFIFGGLNSDFDRFYFQHMAEKSGRFGNPMKYSPFDRFLRMTCTATIIFVGVLSILFLCFHQSIHVPHAVYSAIQSIKTTDRVRGYGLISSFSIWAGFYLMACDADPPCRGRLFVPIKKESDASA